MSTTTLKLAPRFYAGMETYAGTVKRRNQPVLTFEITNFQRVFLFAALQDAHRAINGVYHADPGNLHLPTFHRKQVADAVWRMRDTLDSGALTLLVISRVQHAIMKWAIEQNPYFQTMKDGDWRLTPAAVKEADALRRLAELKLKTKLAKVPLGKDRTRIAEPV